MFGKSLKSYKTPSPRRRPAAPSTSFDELLFTDAAEVDNDSVAIVVVAAVVVVVVAAAVADDDNDKDDDNVFLTTSVKYDFTGTGEYDICNSLLSSGMLL